MNLFKKKKQTRTTESVVSHIIPLHKINTIFLYKIANYEERLMKILNMNNEDNSEALCFNSCENFEVLKIPDDQNILFDSLNVFRFTKNLENVKVNELILKSIGSFNFKNFKEDFSKCSSIRSRNYMDFVFVMSHLLIIQKLSIHSTFISYTNFVSLVRHSHPIEIQLNLVEISNFDINNIKFFSGIKTINVFNSSISFADFETIVSFLKPANCHFQNKNSCFTIYTTEYPFGLCYVRNTKFIDYAFNASIIATVSCSDLVDISFIEKFHNCLFLKITKTSLDASDFLYIKKHKLIQIRLSKIPFMNPLFFYKIISNNSNTLRLVHITDTEIPFDALEFCEKTLVSCKIVLNDSKLRVPVSK